MRSTIRPVLVAMLAASSLPGAGAFLPGTPGVFVSSHQCAANPLRTNAQLPPRVRKAQVTCGLKDVLFSWRNSRIRTAQTSWHQSLFKVPRMGTRVEEEELLRREEAAAKAKASGAGNLWNTDLTTADGAMAVDEVVAAAARKRRAQLSGDSEEQRQAKMAHGFGNEPSKAERLQREEEAAADMQRVLGAKAARLKAQEVPPFRPRAPPHGGIAPFWSPSQFPHRKLERKGPREQAAWAQRVCSSSRTFPPRAQPDCSGQDVATLAAVRAF